jgi:hypothetical protein
VDAIFGALVGAVAGCVDLRAGLLASGGHLNGPAPVRAGVTSRCAAPSDGIGGADVMTSAVQEIPASTRRPPPPWIAPRGLQFGAFEGLAPLGDRFRSVHDAPRAPLGSVSLFGMPGPDAYGVDAGLGVDGSPGSFRHASTMYSTRGQGRHPGLG